MVWKNWSYWIKAYIIGGIFSLFFSIFFVPIIFYLIDSSFLTTFFNQFFLSYFTLIPTFFTLLVTSLLFVFLNYYSSKVLFLKTQSKIIVWSWFIMFSIIGAIAFYFTSFGSLFLDIYFYGFFIGESFNPLQEGFFLQALLIVFLGISFYISYFVANIFVLVRTIKDNTF